MQRLTDQRPSTPCAPRTSTPASTGTSLAACPTARHGFAAPTLWVASAGWGLIPVDAPIRPYSATFSRPAPRLGGRTTPRRAGWWSAVAAWEGPTPGAARSLTALVADHPRDRVLLALVPALLGCLRERPRAALTVAPTDSRQLIAAGVRRMPDLAAWHCQRTPDCRPSSAVPAVSQRPDRRRTCCARDSPTTTRCTRHLRRRLAAAPACRSTSGAASPTTRSSPSSAARRDASRTVSRTRLLRELRDAGMACEQARFADLFTTASKEST